MADDADVSEMEREALIVHGLEAVKMRPRVRPICEECEVTPVMILPNGVYARFCEACWEDRKANPCN